MNDAATEADEASAEDARNGDETGLIEASADGPELGDAGQDVAVADAPTLDAIEEPPPGYDGPTCTGNPPAGDGGTWCTLYTATDHDGEPSGIAVHMECGPQGSPCTACLQGIPFAGLCE